MRILMLCQLFPPLAYGGGEALFWDLAKSLVSRGHRVYVITQKVKGAKNFEVQDGVTIQRVGIPVAYTGALTTSVPESLVYLVQATFAAFRLFSKGKVDIVHSNTYVPALVGQVCATLLGVGHVMTVHDVYLGALPWFWKEWAEQPNVSRSARFFGPALERLVLRTPAATIHTVSETSKRDLAHFGIKSRKISVVPNGIDLAEYPMKAHFHANQHQAIFIGRLVFYKNLDTVIRAFSKVVLSVPDAKLVVVGDGPMRLAWQRLSKELGLQDHVRFCGFVAHRRKIGLLAQSEFLVLPSKVEGFGIVILEAFACGRPVLVSRIGALQEVVRNGVEGFLLDPTSEDEWARKMIQLFRDNARTRKMGKAGKNRVAAHFAVDRVEGDMEKLYGIAMGQETATSGQGQTSRLRRDSAS